MELTQAQQEVQTNYQQRKERVANLTNLTLQSTDGSALPPTPTQEENDLLALGLMHPDEKAQSPQDKAMPSVAAQQAYLADGTALPSASAPTTAARTTTSTRTTSSTGASGASGATGA